MPEADRVIQRVLAESFSEVFRRAGAVMDGPLLEIWMNAFLSAAGAFAVRRFGARAAYGAFQRVADVCAEDLMGETDAAGS